MSRWPLVAIFLLIASIVVLPRWWAGRQQTALAPLPDVATGGETGGTGEIPVSRRLDEELIRVDRECRESPGSHRENLARWEAFLELSADTEYATYATLQVAESRRLYEKAGAAALSRIGRDHSGQSAEHLITALDQVSSEFPGTAAADRAGARLRELRGSGSTKQPVFDRYLIFKTDKPGGPPTDAQYAHRSPGVRIVKVDHLRTDHPQRVTFTTSGGSRLELEVDLPPPARRNELVVSFLPATLEGVAHSECTIEINGKILQTGWTPRVHFVIAYRWDVGSYLHPGKNTVVIKLDRRARTVMNVLRVHLRGYAD